MSDPELDETASAVDQLTSQMRALDGVTQQFGRSLARALSSGIAQGKGFEDILRNIGQRFIDIALRAAFKPLETGFSSLASNLFSGLGQAASGLGGSLGSVLPFADGGVISTPHYFPLSRGMTGLAGERGAEAILPLARGPDGRLGVAANGGNRAPVTVHMTISTPDAESFRRGEAQVSAALARAVARGQRNL
jgi:phage-related minor tail protein